MAEGQHCSSYVRPGHDPMEFNIDRLNNELLVAILSHLSVKEAAKTCLVSRRWRYLWQYTTGCLEIYDERTIVPELARRFMKLINHVLDLHQGPTLDQFRVGFCYSGSWFTFDHWVKFAIQKEVKIFELNLAVCGRGRCVGWGQYDFPDIERLSSTDTDKLKLSRFCFSLKSLTLVNVGVKEEIINFFLSNCPCLEQVRISGSNCLHNVKVTSPLPSLKSMEISWCSGVKGLEVDASNLVSFTYIGPDILLPFQNVPLLSELTIGEEYCFSFIFKGDKHSSYSSKLRKLKLTVPFKVMCSILCTFTCPDNFPILDNLRELELEFELPAGESLLFFTFFTKASPLLFSFTARIRYTDFLAEERMAHHSEHPIQLGTHFVHKHLKVVKLIGFTGCRSDFELALHFLEIGGSLEKIILQPTYDSIHRQVSGKALTYKQSKLLEAKLPPGAKLVML